MNSLQEMEDTSELKIFRNPFQLDEGQVLYMRFGPLEVYIGHFAKEWRVSWFSSNDYMDTSFKVSLPFSEKVPEELLSQKRYAYSRDCNSYLKLTPVLGDKPFVVRPTKPLMILPGEKVSIYMSIPLFLRIEAEDPYHVLEEIPTLQSAKTWFGESTRVGEICYSTRIKAVLDEKELVHRPYRALCKLIIENQGEDALHVEKLKVPAPYLALFQSEEGRFYTSLIQYVREPDGAIKNIDVMEPDQGSELFFLSGPRLKADHSILSPIIHLFGRV